MAKKPTIKTMYTTRNRTVYNNKKNMFIVEHYVGAVSTAKANAKYFKSTYRGASANYFVDDNEIYCVVNPKNAAWHCGGGSQGSGGKKFFGVCKNSNSIGIELCCKRDSNGNLYISEKTLKRAAQLTQWLMGKYDIGESHVIRHFDVTGKRCPAMFVNETKWIEAKRTLVGGSTGGKPTVPSKTLVRGNVNSHVADLQEMLNWFISKKQISATKLVIDKSFGAKTEKVVKRWQKEAKARNYYTGKIDGSFGAKSRGAAKAWLADL